MQEAAVLCNKALLFSLRCTRCKNPTRSYTYKVAVFKKCISSAKDKINTSIYGTPSEYKSSHGPRCKLLRPQETILLVFLRRKRCQKKCVLITYNNRIFHYDIISIKIESDSLTVFFTRSGRIFKYAFFKSNIISVTEDCRRSESMKGLTIFMRPVCSCGSRKNRSLDRYIAFTEYTLFLFYNMFYFFHFILLLLIP